MDSLKNKVAIITGGSGGIGKATAKLFLDQGAKIMLVGRTENTLKNVVKELDNSNVKYCVADVSKSEDTQNYISETLSIFGKIDIFFNNAGIEGASKHIVDYPEDIFDKVIAINLKGVWLGCQHVIPKMSNGGSVIITSSVAGLKGFKGLGAYVASKHAVIGIMRTAALENADRGIRVNTIHPGPVNTRMMRDIEKNISPDNPKEVQKGFEANIPFGRYAEANEIGELVLFLASDQSKYITGTTHVIDGGMNA
ncbi:NAD(P)-dependent dehydrogenase (short-subunit alcohol dehydrogenase family) [Aquimarina sp. MAR_2010_214]|uniref:SDR family NAD(P)-dependent oxidoreductase n=1 Tax=Aquimarina sp. MAR_2010_214 TaxID=1250026 RepID=UPI000C704B25|nr:SDR family oxidoreductase [Aquimarina sp. MAR_2010_214]PKV50635.1 NAD(P)-dependent dehydrogenase (short-subunit alcohol dehydrogenase family) [Aquimarina sp. MAR_2010_214]